MAPSHLRGALNILFQLSVTIGILAAQLINYGTQHFYWGWRVSLGCAIVPAIILFIGSLTLPGALQLSHIFAAVIHTGTILVACTRARSWSRRCPCTHGVSPVCGRHRRQVHIASCPQSQRAEWLAPRVQSRRTR